MNVPDSDTSMTPQPLCCIGSRYHIAILDLTAIGASTLDSASHIASVAGSMVNQYELGVGGGTWTNPETLVEGRLK